MENGLIVWQRYNWDQPVDSATHLTLQLNGWKSTWKHFWPLEALCLISIELEVELSSVNAQIWWPIPSISDPANVSANGVKQVGKAFSSCLPSAAPMLLFESRFCYADTKKIILQLKTNAFYAHLLLLWFSIITRIKIETLLLLWGRDHRSSHSHMTMYFNI